MEELLTMLKDILLTLGGAVFGAALGAWLSKKHEKETNDIKKKSIEILDSLESAIKSRLDKIIFDITANQSQGFAMAIFSGNFQTKNLSKIPGDTDFPHIIFYYEGKEPTDPGNELKIICRFRDTGINFNIESGTTAVFKQGSKESRMTIVQYLNGHALLTVKVPNDADFGPAEINMKMTDFENNSFEQTIPVTIGAPHQG